MEKNIKLPSEKTNIPNTGERFLTNWKGYAYFEHYHRYFLASNYVSGKIVLDIASGEGYGSYILSQRAQYVYGVDISEKAINFAKLKYKTDNMSFHCSSATSIPMESKSVDIVVSFETIEHIDDQERFMSEVKRVLKDDGILIISSPDKNIRLDVEHHYNAFHISELTKEEFNIMLNTWFKNVSIMNQQVMSGSYIIKNDTNAHDLLFYERNQKQEITSESKLQLTPYLVAFASDSEIPDITTSFFIDTKLSDEGMHISDEDSLINQFVTGHESLQIFYSSEGDYYKEEDSIIYDILNAEVLCTIQLEAEKKLTNIRIDPITHPGVVDLKNVSVVFEDHSSTNLDILYSNAHSYDRGLLYFSNEDPQILFKADKPIIEVHISYTILASMHYKDVSLLEALNKKLVAIKMNYEQVAEDNASYFNQLKENANGLKVLHEMLSMYLTNQTNQVNEFNREYFDFLETQFNKIDKQIKDDRIQLDQFVTNNMANYNNMSNKVDELKYSLLDLFEDISKKEELAISSRNELLKMILDNQRLVASTVSLNKKSIAEIEILSNRNSEMNNHLEDIEQQIHVLEQALNRNYQTNNAMNDLVMKTLTGVEVINEQLSGSLWNRIVNRIFRLKNIKVYKYIKKSSLFDSKFYSETYSVAHKQLDHFVFDNKKYQFNPNCNFDCNFYLNAYQDIKESKINPFYHYLKYGYKEGRIPNVNPDMFQEWVGIRKITKEGLISIFKRWKTIYIIWNSKKFDFYFYYNENDDYKNWRSESKWTKYLSSSHTRKIAAMFMHPVYHYVTRGVLLGHNPTRTFDTKYYIHQNHDVAVKGINPFLHYIKFGENEQRTTMRYNNDELSSDKNDDSNLPIISQSDDVLLPYKEDKEVIFIGHEAELTGAPKLLLTIVKWFTERTAYRTKVILLRGGTIVSEYQSITETLVLDLSGDKAVNEEIIHNFVGSGQPFLFLNTIVSARISEYIDINRYKHICYVHELEETIKIFSKEMKLVEKNIKTLITGSDAVRDNLIEKHAYHEDQIKTIYSAIEIKQGINASMLDTEDEWLREKSIKIIGCGTAYWRKNPLGFVNVAKEVIHSTNIDVQFLWIGDGEDIHRIELEIDKHDLGNHVMFVGQKPDIQPYFLIGDIFLLTSVEDPYPLVCLEAANNEMPIVCFSDAGGVPEFVGDDAGFSVPFKDYEIMADKVKWLIAHEEERLRLGQRAKEKMIARHSIDVAGQEIKSIIDNLLNMPPAVSVIVPNYNHGLYLDKRLSSIYNQSFKDFEIIILDDCSTDNSREIIDHFDTMQPVVTRSIYNEKNAGNVFKQWMKGLDLAQADIVWIAESDDYCDEELLSMLLPYFRDDRVNLAYTQSKVIGSNDEVYAEDYFHYTDDISTDKWKHTYKRTLHRELNEGFAVKNLIPNASAVLFRKFEFTQYEQEMLLNFKAAGDWLFYLFALKDGLLAFHPEALNCHRRHPNSVISKNDNKTSIILDETIKIQQYIFKNYSIHKTIKLKMENQIKLAFSIEDFDYTAYIKDFSSRSLFDNATNLHILITVSEIGFGGGEIFPIRLANNLSDNLIKVTILNIENRPTVDQVLKMINPEINVISVNDCIRKNIDFKKLIGDYSITTIFSFVWWADKFVYENLRDLDVQWYSYMAGCHESLINTPQVGDFQQIMPDIVHYIDGFVYSADKNLEVFKKYELTKYVNGKLHKVPLGNTKKGRVKKGLKEKYGILKDEFVVTLIARGIPEKGWREAINAVISLRDKGYRIHLLLGGESDFVDQLKRKYKTNKYIDFLDFVSDTSEPIAISDVCLLPTYYSSESMPMVIIEYLSLGKPVIATDIGEIKWMLETEKGIAGTILKLKNGKVDVKNVENAIETYLNTPEQIRAHSELAYEAFQKFSMDRFSQKFLEMVLDND